MHVRTQIRNAALKLLQGLPLTGDKVHKPPMYLKDASQLPCLRVRCGDEQIEPMTIHGSAPISRVMQLTVDCFAMSRDDVDADVNEVAAAVEEALDGMPLTDEQGKVLVVELNLVGFVTGLSNELEKPVAHTMLTFNAEYFIKAGEPSTAF